MPSFNKIILLGHAGGSPDAHFTTKGDEFYVFSLAVNKGKDEDPDWFRVLTFAPFAKEIQKGDLVFVEGSMRSERYNDRTYWTVYANKIFRLRGPLSISNDIDEDFEIEPQDTIPF